MIFLNNSLGCIICIGSPQHLKSKYGSGFTLEVKLKLPGVDALEREPEAHSSLAIETGQGRRESLTHETHGNFTFTYIKDHFPESRLTESFGNRAVFAVPQRGVKSISKTFSLLEKCEFKMYIQLPSGV